MFHIYLMSLLCHTYIFVLNAFDAQGHVILCCLASSYLTVNYYYYKRVHIFRLLFHFIPLE